MHVYNHAILHALKKGRDLEQLFREMSKPQGDIARVLRSHTSALTDITGFGLAGHLYNICRQSKLGARIMIDKIPVYNGVRDLLSSGVRTSIFNENMKYAVPGNYLTSRLLCINYQK